MPEAAHCEHYHDVQYRPRLPSPVASERDVKIIHEPGCQGDMPPFPEFLEGGGKVRTPEIVVETEPEQAGRTYGDLGVSGEVKVQLEGEEKDRHKDRKPLMGSRFRVN